MNPADIKIGDIFKSPNGYNKGFEVIKVTAVNEGSFFYTRWIKSKAKWSSQAGSTMYFDSTGLGALERMESPE